eukprot:CAMPEP_0196760834 /NCGR_PEP_ID=MMETSP1091-20130531/105439_1 /TAXON_ID=302021 /ORGANISM="Rhodomonas sp., Strain CCMP768" /LENGTH=97 /DNA_ID=CAMNT_0042109761 /DNA_START=753 /DNA_END=1047 /DNA_ORIENTATION=-
MLRPTDAKAMLKECNHNSFTASSVHLEFVQDECPAPAPGTPRQSVERSGPLLAGGGGVARHAERGGEGGEHGRSDAGRAAAEEPECDGDRRMTYLQP